MNAQRKLFWSILVTSLLLWGSAIAGDDKPSGKLVIDEIQVMFLKGRETHGDDRCIS